MNATADELRPYIGLWVATRDGKVIFSGETPTEVVRLIAEHGETGDALLRVPIFRVPIEPAVDVYDRLAAAEQEAKTLRLIMAMLGGSLVDVEGVYVGTPGFELRQLRSKAAAYDELIPKLVKLRADAHDDWQAAPDNRLHKHYRDLLTALLEATNASWIRT
jgi:hypothetical protein